MYYSRIHRKSKITLMQILFNNIFDNKKSIIEGY